jgi:serine/threonine protein kinase
MADLSGQPTYSDGDVVPELPGYRIERQLGRGSMGVVYLAEDVQLRRKVALKVLSPTLADDELFRKRFDRESQSAANLDHPNIVPVYAAGEAGESLYIAMRYVAGGDLRALLDANGPLGLEQAAAIVMSVADALDAAHAQGMIHRDVKPANILIDGRNGQEHYYLSDFGITKIVSSGRSLTSTGQIIGTIDYIAPEQIQGKPVDGRADLYALGCVLYQCLTGAVPFPRDETAALMWAHVHDEVSPVSARRPDLPPQIDSIVAKAIAKQPEDRYDTCRELALAVRILAAHPAASGDSGRAWVTSPVDSPASQLISAGMTSTYTPPTHAPVRAAASSSTSLGWRWWWFAAGALILALIGGSTVGVMKYFSSRFPNAAEQALLGEVPLALTMKNSCTRNAEAEQDTANVQASVTCTSDGNTANTVVFTKFTSAKALGSHYQRAVATAGIGPGSGDCLNTERAEGSYASESSRTSGRTVCYQQRGSSFVAWTDDQAHMLGQATRVDPDYPKLRDWWAGVVGLPTKAEIEAKAQANKQVEDAQKQVEAANKKAEEAQQQAEAAKKQQAEDAKKRQEDDAKKQQAADTQKQIDAANDAKKQAEEAQKQLRQSQQQAQNERSQNQNNGQSQDSRRQSKNNRSQNPNDGSQNPTSGSQNPTSGSQNPTSGSQNPTSGSQNPTSGSQNPTDGSQNPTSGRANSGGQDLQQLIADAIKRAIQQQRYSGDQGLLQQQIEDEVRKSIQQQGSSGGGQSLQQLINDAINRAIEARQGQR